MSKKKNPFNHTLNSYLKDNGKIQTHLIRKQIKMPTPPELVWIAAPFFCLWKAEFQKNHVWILLNDLTIDSFIDKDLSEPEQALAYFCFRWQHANQLQLRNEITVSKEIHDKILYSNMHTMGTILGDIMRERNLKAEVVPIMN